MPFEKGISGNPLGRRKEKKVRTALVMALLQAGDDLESLRRIWQAQINKALDGDLSAAKEIFDRLDGKVPQAIIGGDDEDNPIRLEGITVRFIEPGFIDTKGLPAPDEAGEV